MPIKFYKHICQEKNFLYLNGQNVLRPNVLEIISGFIDADEGNYRLLQNNLSSYKNIFQYIYTNASPEIYCSTEKRGFDLKSNFHIIFKIYKDKKQLESSMGKNPVHYKSIRKETNIYEQKPINIDDFNESEEAEVKQQVDKRKQKRRDVAEKNTLKKKTKGRGKKKKKEEKDMWNRLVKLNGEFKEIKKAKKESKKMSETIIN